MIHRIFFLEFARPPLNSTKDDLVLTSNHTKLNRRKSTKDMPSNPTSRFPVNRYSVGDFSQLTQFNQFAASPKGYHMHSYSDGGSGEPNFFALEPIQNQSFKSVIFLYHG